MDKATELKSSLREKLMYSIGDAGGTLLMMFISTFLTVYYTDSVGLAAAYAGSMMLICRLCDGISDVIVGILIDRTHTRWGKAKPWFVLSILPLAISFIAVYNVPEGISDTGFKIYTMVTYFLVTVVFYTINNIAYHAMLQRFSFTSSDRSNISAIRSIMCSLAGIAMSTATPILIPVLGGEKNQQTWSTLGLAYGVLSTIFLLVTALGIKEKIKDNTDDSGKKTDDTKQSTLAQLKVVLKCKYFYIAILVVLFYFTSVNMSSIGFYFARDVIGDLKFMSISGLVSLPVTLIGIPFVPLVFRKFGKRRSIITGLIIATVATLVVLFDPYSPGLNIACSIVKLIATLPIMIAVSTFAGDICDYNHMRSGVRCEGVTTSAYTVGNKLGTGLGPAIVGWMLALGNYNSTIAVQSQTTINLIIVVVSVVPAFLYIGGIIAMVFWDIEKYQSEVQAFMTTQIGVKKDK